MTTTGIRVCPIHIHRIISKNSKLNDKKSKFLSNEYVTLFNNKMF